MELLETRCLLAAWTPEGDDRTFDDPPYVVAASTDQGEVFEFLPLGSGESSMELFQIPRGRPTLNAEGSTFVTDTGQLLRGPFASTEWGNPPPLSAIQQIKNFGANAIHLYGEVFDPNYVSGVPGSGTAPGYSAGRIDQMVQMTRDEGLYLVLTIGNGGNNGDFNYDYVMDFWSFYAPRYADEAHVIFEVQNEPHAWSAPYPQAALDMEADAYELIRSHAPDTPVLLFSFAVLGSGPAAVNDINAVSAAASVDWTNAGVAIHGYAGWEATAESAETIIDAGYPVFMTEFAASDWGEQGSVIDVEMVAELERLNVSWLTFQHVPPNFISSSFNDTTKFADVIDRAGISWTPDFGTWPLPRSVYGNDGMPWATAGLSGTLRIEAENYDNGGESVGYHDSDAANVGIGFRPGEGVDTLRSSEPGGGFAVTATAPGEWLEYTLFVDEPGYYDVSLRYAAPTVDGSVRLWFNGDDRSGEMALPITGGQTTWATASKQVFLEFGRQKLRVEVIAGGFDLNWVEMTPTSSSPIANGAYKLLNRNSGLPAEADTANTTVVQNAYTGATNERWTLVHRGAGQFSITSAVNGWSWSTFYNGNDDPINLAPWGYDGAADRRFILVPDEGGYFHILVVDGGLSAEVAGAALTPGVGLQQQVYAAASSQQWAILAPEALTPPTGLAASWGDPEEVPGDYDSNGAVAGSDFLAWQRDLGAVVGTNGASDGNGDGVVDADDLSVWSDSFGHGSDDVWIQLAWNPTAGATAYNVKRSTAPTGPFQTIAAGVSDLSFNDTGLDGGVRYFYTVSATNRVGESLDSAPSSPAVLHAHWMFDEFRGVVAMDATGNGWTGDLINGVLHSPGLTGNAIELDGSNDYVSLPAGLAAGLTQTTVAGWFNLESADTWSRLFDFGTGTNNYMFLTPRSGGAGDVRFAITTGSGEQRIDGDAPLPTGEWVHVAVTLDGGTGVLYVNGVEAGRNTGMTLSPSSLGVTTQNYLGRSQFSADPYLSGLIDEFRIYTDVLDSNDIASLAATPPLAQLASWESSAEALEVAAVSAEPTWRVPTGRTVTSLDGMITSLVSASGTDFDAMFAAGQSHQTRSVRRLLANAAVVQGDVESPYDRPQKRSAASELELADLAFEDWGELRSLGSAPTDQIVLQSDRGTWR